MERELRFRINSSRIGSIALKDVEVSVEEVVRELQGPMPMPTIGTLRGWDLILLNRYRPFYMPACDYCCLCTYGKCDLSEGKRGACGIDVKAQQARIVALACAIGAATHCSHARHLVEYLIHKYGRDYKLDMGPEINIVAPNTMLVTGIVPKTLGDLEKALEYVEREITKVLCAIHTGQEGHHLDYESKALHLGMLDHVGMEIADLAQTVALNFPKGEEEQPFVELGLGLVDYTKATVLCIGHNVSDGAEIVAYLEKSGLKKIDLLEIAGLCCTAHDISRHTHGESKIIGPISYQLKYIRMGFADTIVIDEQCINIKVVEEARKVMSPVIACTDKVMHGLPDLTEMPADEIVKLLASGKYPGAVILDEEKVGEVAVKLALRMAVMRGKYKKIPTLEELKKEAEKCVRCHSCRRNCPQDLPVSDAVYELKKGNPDLLRKVGEYCLGCGRCEDACPRGVPILSLMIAVLEKDLPNERYRIRIGRGPVRDTEIRAVGRDIVLGQIPGVIAMVGCANWPRGARENAIMAREFARRGFIVVATGCAAMAIGMMKNEEGLTPYEEFGDAFDRGCILNIGSCVANAHISGAVIKIANIFAGRNIIGNYEEIADYILNRVGACGIAWGAMSQKAASIATGFNRLGVPVIVGPHGVKYRRMLLGREEDEERWYAIDMRTGEKVYTGPAPAHLIYAAETMEECMVMAVKLCIRPSDTPQGRAIKLAHYIDLYRKFYGTLPPDIHYYVRTEADIPVTYKNEVLEHLREVGWKPWEYVCTDVTLVPRVYEKYRGGKKSTR